MNHYMQDSSVYSDFTIPTDVYCIGRDCSQHMMPLWQK